MANSIDFSDATVLGYNQDNYFFGDGIARYGSTRRISLEVMTHNVSGVGFNNDGVSQSWSGFSGAMASGDNFGAVTVNGYDLGSGIVESIAITTQNPVRVGRHRVNIECPHTNSNDMHNLGSSSTSGGTYAGYSDIKDNTNRDLIRDFSETFSFEESEEGDYSHEHSVGVRFEEGRGTVDEIEEAKSLASGLFAASNAPEFGYLPGIAGFYETKASNNHYFTESYDLLSKSCSFTKVLKIEGQDATNYTKKITHSVVLNANGIVSVTENCSIKGKDTYIQATDGMAAELHETNNDTAHTRCLTFFNNYKTNYLGPKYSGSSDDAVSASESPTPNPTTNTTSLNNKPLSLQKQYFKKKKKVSYSITYNNDPNIKDNFIHNFSMNYAEDKTGSLTITQSGRILPYDTGSKSADFNKVAIRNRYKEVKNGSPNDLNSFLVNSQNYYTALRDSSGPSSANLVATSSSISFPRAGREISYTKQYSDNISLRGGYTTSAPDDDTADPKLASTFPINIKKLEVTVSDTAPALIKSTYMIPNKSDSYQLIHEPQQTKAKQTNMGKRSIRIRALKSRIAGKNVFTDIPSLTVQLSYLKDLALVKAANVIIDFEIIKYDWYVDSCSYSFNNNRELDFNLNVAYATKSKKGYTNIDPTRITTP
jgi:hypothetical protein